MNQQEFSLDVEEVAWFYARGGNYVEIMPYGDAPLSMIELYLNGSVFGAILHQRKTLPLHASCFWYKGLGIMVCGESGVGKSSLTTSFCLNGADFLTDDVTPVVFTNGKPHIWAVSDRVKLWSDSLEQLNQQERVLERIVPGQSKFYFPMDGATGAVYPLHHILILNINDDAGVCIQALAGIEKFTALRNEIYRWEYLQWMTESEVAYVAQLLTVAQTVRVTKVSRPANILIENFQLALEKLFIEGKLIMGLIV